MHDLPHSSLFLKHIFYLILGLSILVWFQIFLLANVFLFQKPMQFYKTFTWSYVSVIFRYCYYSVSIRELSRKRCLSSTLNDNLFMFIREWHYILLDLKQRKYFPWMLKPKVHWRRILSMLSLIWTPILVF